MKTNRIIYLVFILVLSVCHQIQAQIPTINAAVRVLANFDRNNGQLTFTSENEDFCDYYVHVNFLDVDGFDGLVHNQGLSAIVGRGRKQIRTYKAKTGANRYVYRYNYILYRGNSAIKPDTNFIYALPVADGDTVKTKIQGYEGGYQVVFDLPSDTIFACRGGVVCDDNLRRSPDRSYMPAGNITQISLYHNDGSLSGYVFKGRPLIYAGQRIKMGSPIAVVESDSNKYSVCLSTYFLDRNKVNSNIPRKHTNFLPFFKTSNEEKVKLKTEESYVCELTDEMRMQEMSKSEKKKLKNK